MTVKAWPFDGADVMESEWRQMARLWRRDGVIANPYPTSWAPGGPTGPFGELNELAVTQRAAGANMSVDVASGRAWVHGHYMESDAVVNVPVQAAHATLSRTDLIVVRLDFATNQPSIVAKAGTPGGAGAGTETSDTRWEFPLAVITVPAAAASILTANIADVRMRTPSPYGARLDAARPHARAITNAGQSIPNGASTDVQFAQPSPAGGRGGQDPYGFYNIATPGKFTVPAGLDGLYRIRARVVYQVSSSGSYREAVLYAGNGTGNNVDLDDRNPNGGRNVTCEVGVTMWLDAGHIVRVATLHDAASALSLVSGYSMLEVEMLGSSISPGY